MRANRYMRTNKSRTGSGLRREHEPTGMRVESDFPAA
jgi:hypothetical protein